MPEEYKFAYDTFAIDAEKYTIDDKGRLHVSLRVAKVGIMDYPGERRYMPPEVLKAAVDAESLDYAIITRMHEGAMIDIDNLKEYGKGLIKPGSQFDSLYINSDSMIESRDLIEDILTKKVREVSAGYKFKTDGKPGKNEHGEFDTSYTFVQYNHVSAVTKGRAGRDVKFELDNKGEPMSDIERPLLDFKIGTDQILDGVTISYGKESKTAMDTMSTREQKLIEVIRKQENEIITLKSAETANKESFDTMKTAQDGMIKKSDLNEMTAELLDVRQAAEKIGLDCKEEVDSHLIRQKVLEKLLPNSYKSLQDKDQLKNHDAVAAAYDSCKENMGFNVDVHKTQEALDLKRGFKANPQTNPSPQFPLFNTIEGFKR